jgi:hypothetical protein
MIKKAGKQVLKLLTRKHNLTVKQAVSGRAGRFDEIAFKDRLLNVKTRRSNFYLKCENRFC